MTRVIRKNLGPFAAILVLVALAAVVGAYILDEQRLRFPLAEPKPFRVNVEFDNAQAVTPGQGQTAQVAGVRIGDIAEVTLRDGRAIVGLDIEPRYRDLIRARRPRAAAPAHRAEGHVRPDLPRQGRAAGEGGLHDRRSRSR